LNDYDFFGKPKSNDEILGDIFLDCLTYISGEGNVSYLPKRYEDNWALYEFFRRVVQITRKRAVEEIKRIK